MLGPQELLPIAIVIGTGYLVLKGKKLAPKAADTMNEKVMPAAKEGAKAWVDAFTKREEEEKNGAEVQ